MDIIPPLTRPNGGENNDFLDEFSFLLSLENGVLGVLGLVMFLEPIKANKY